MSFNQKLAFVAFLLSSLAMIVSMLYPEAIYQERNNNPKYLSVIELAELIKNRSSYTLIDLRSEEDFQQFRIPTSKNYPFPVLSHSLIEGDRILLYSDSDTLSVQAYSRLKEIGVQNVSIVEGGVYDWYDRILYPKMPLEVREEQLELSKKVKALSAYYGGQPIFVADENPLDYYNGKTHTKPKRYTSKLVRMGC